jgi:hypothetical protein
MAMKSCLKRYGGGLYKTDTVISTYGHSTVQYSTVQYSTVQYSTVQYSTVQYSTVQYVPCLSFDIGFKRKQIYQLQWIDVTYHGRTTHKTEWWLGRPLEQEFKYFKLMCKQTTVPECYKRDEKIKKTVFNLENDFFVYSFGTLVVLWRKRKHAFSCSLWNPYHVPVASSRGITGGQGGRGRQRQFYKIKENSQIRVSSNERYNYIYVYNYFICSWWMIILLSGLLQYPSVLVTDISRSML